MMFTADGKILVVAAVLGIILIGLAMLLFYLEWRLGKAEKKIENLESRTETAIPTSRSKSGNSTATAHNMANGKSGTTPAE